MDGWVGGWGVGGGVVLSPGCVGESHEPFAVTNSYQRQDSQTQTLSSTLLYSCPPPSTTGSYLSYLIEHPLASPFAILMKIRHLPCQPRAPARQAPATTSRGGGKDKWRKEKARVVRESGNDTLSEEGYCVTG